MSQSWAFLLKQIGSQVHWPHFRHCLNRGLISSTASFSASSWAFPPTARWTSYAPAEARPKIPPKMLPATWAADAARPGSRDYLRDPAGRRGRNMHVVPRLVFTLDLPGVSRHALWDFHRDPKMLERLTPPDKKVTVRECPDRMGSGSRVVLRLRQFGITIDWVSRIEAWEPEVRFVDVQLSGPFARWRHEHLFEEGRLVDTVDYEVPLALLGGRLVDLALIRPDLTRMFAFRHDVTRRALSR